MFRAAASLIAPPRCSVCGAPVAREAVICARCRRGLERLGPHTSALAGFELRTAARYEGVARELVARLKFSQRLALATVAAERMAEALGAAGCGALVPVPAAPARQRARGFDTAALLARRLAELAGAATCPCLERDDGPRQVGRPRARRLEAPPRVRLKSGLRAELREPVWIVDDVTTTGATLVACAAALRQHGVRDVRAVTFARA